MDEVRGASSSRASVPLSMRGVPHSVAERHACTRWIGQLQQLYMRLPHVADLLLTYALRNADKGMLHAWNCAMNSSSIQNTWSLTSLENPSQQPSSLTHSPSTRDGREDWPLAPAEKHWSPRLTNRPTGIHLGSIPTF